ncbi:hypothetical protein D3C87_1828800 [compost metagenome]
MAVYHVPAEKHRYFQAALLSRVLHGSVYVTGYRAVGTTDPPGGDLFAYFFGRHLFINSDQPQLADFFLQGHLIYQVADKGFFA